MGIQNYYSAHCRQTGSALVITLMVLAAVTILGIAGMNAICTELKLSRNEREVQESFYLAEAAALEAVQLMHNASRDDLNDRIFMWHHRRGEDHKQLDFRKPEQWIVAQNSDDNAMGSVMHPNSYFSAVEWDVAAGASLIVTDSRLYANRIYGLNKRSNSDIVIEIGYYLRY